MSASAEILNEMFTQRLDSPEGKAKIAQAAGSFIRDRLREESFWRKVLPPTQVTRSDLQRSVNHDTLVKIVEIEPESRAMSITFRGQPQARVIRAPRFEIGFWSITSEKFEKTEQELLAYEMPITKIIENNSLKDIQEIEDRTGLGHAESCVQQLNLETGSKAVALTGKFVADGGATSGVTKGHLAQISVNADTATDFTVLDLDKTDLTSLFRLFVKNGTRLRCDRFLLTEHDFEGMMSWQVEDFGDKVMSEVVVDGYKFNVVMGRKFIRTIKSDILRDGNIFAFCAPDFLGRFYILNQTKFYIDKIANRITWQCWEDIGMGIGNIAAIRKLELYCGDNRAAITDSVAGAVRPKAEEDLGASNNRVDDGFVFPKVSQF